MDETGKEVYWGAILLAAAIAFYFLNASG